VVKAKSADNYVGRPKNKDGNDAYLFSLSLAKSTAFNRTWNWLLALWKYPIFRPNAHKL